MFHALAERPEGLSHAQLAYRLGLPLATVQGMVTVLAGPPIVCSPAQISAGPALLRLAAEANQSLQQEMRPLLEKLREQCNETVCLASWNGERLLCIDMLAGSHQLQALAPIGESFPLYCTAAGKAVLAALSPERIEQLLPTQLEPLTRETITDRSHLLLELERVRREEIAYEREEYTPGGCALSTTLRDTMMGTLVALTVLLPATRFSDHGHEIAAILLESYKQRAGGQVRGW